MAISLNQAQIKELKKTLNSLELEPRKRQRLIWRLGKYGAIPAIKRYIKFQKEVDGSDFEKRKRSSKRRMLNKITRMIAIREYPEKGAIKLYFRGKYKSTASAEISAGVIAGIHQDGLTIQQNKSQFKNVKDKEGKTQKQKLLEPCSKSQQKKLRQLGYLRPDNKKKASGKWLAENLSRGQAGLIIKKMEGKELSKSSWSITLPSRTFFGLNDEDFKEALAKELERINFGWDVNKQEMKRGIK